MAASAYHVISKDVKNYILRHNWILDRHVCVNNSSGKVVDYNIFVQILYSYFRYTGRIFLGCALFVAHCSIIRASWKTKKEWRLSYRKKYIEEPVRGKSLFWLHVLLSVLSFATFFVLLPPSESVPTNDVLAEWPL